MRHWRPLLCLGFSTLFLFSCQTVSRNPASTEEQTVLESDIKAFKKIVAVLARNKMLNDRYLYIVNKETSRQFKTLREANVQLHLLAIAQKTNRNQQLYQMSQKFYDTKKALDAQTSLYQKAALEFIKGHKSLRAELQNKGFNSLHFESDPLFLPFYPEITVEDKLEIRDLNSLKGTDPRRIYYLRNMAYITKFKIKNITTHKLNFKFSCEETPTEKILLEGFDIKAMSSRSELLSSDKINCVMNILDPEAPKEVYTLNIRSQGVGKSTLAKGRSFSSVCFYDPNFVPTNVSSFYANLNKQNVGCTWGPVKAKLFPAPFDGLNEKISILTGGDRISDEILQSEHPDINHQLNFSKAPQFEQILLYYLEFKNDFSGRMLAQALEYHAKRGTQIKIVLPGASLPNMVKMKDWNLLKTLESKSPNIRIEKITIKSTPDVPNLLGSLHRVVHAKLLIATSKDPQQNYVVTGGRNIKDTFIFRSAPIFDDPGMIQYNRGDEKFRPFDDLDIVVQNESLAKLVAEQMLSFFNHDIHTLEYRQMALNIAIPGLADIGGLTPAEENFKSIYARHTLSVPPVNGDELEELFIDFIHQAHESIIITSPYFYPPAGIRKALIAAANRGVHVTFLTQTDHTGDENFSLVSDINRLGVNLFIGHKNIEVWDWQQKTIQHSKSFLIDNKVLFIGTANMNMRSYVHDVENGLLLMGDETIGEYLEMIKDHKEKSKKLNKKEYVSIMNRILILLGRPFM